MQNCAIFAAVKELAQIISPIATELAHFEAFFGKTLHADTEPMERIMRYVGDTRGKRLRPMLVLLSAKLFGQVNERTVRAAAFVELVHSATLLHDDVADNSAERRGVPTVMSLLGGPASVLIGDFWLVKAMDSILSSEKSGNIVIRIFAKTLSDLAEGEMLQLQKTATCDTSEADYLRIIYCKTASLFEAAAVSGAISGGGDATLVEAVKSYARNLGIAFQIKDDMLDYAGSPVLGKPSGVDILEQKITMPLLAALGNVSEEEASAIRKKVGEVIDNPSVAEEIKKFVSDQNGLELSQKKVEGFISAALSSLSALPDSKEKSYLAKIAHFCITLIIKIFNYKRDLFRTFFKQHPC